MEDRQDRGEQMARRLERAARGAGLGSNAPRLAGLFRAILEQRVRAFPDLHHPDFLHPGRTVLILLEDLRNRNPDVLLAAPLHDSERPDLDLPVDIALNHAGPHAVALTRTLRDGPPLRQERLEWLVQLESDALLVTLAERFDHARHLHLAPPARWREFHCRFGQTDLLAASRSDPRLAARMRWWHDSFARRFLPRAP
jgi:hypothetical protein